MTDTSPTSPTSPLIPESDWIKPFQEGTIRVPLRGEEALVHKEAVVTGEVVISKERTVRREEVVETVRRQHVEVNEVGEVDGAP